MSGDTPSGILQPGQRIKPNVSIEQAKQLIQQYYGYQVTKVKELNSYDDNNFYIETDDSYGFGEKFIFKVLNSLDSRKPGHIEAENAGMLYLSLDKKINCPIPQQTLNGNTFALVSVSSNSNQPDSENNDIRENSSTTHAIRLLKYLEGKLLCDVTITPKLLSETGAYIAQLGNHLKGFSHPALVGHDTMWMLHSVPKILQFAYVFQNQKAKLNLVYEIVNEFKLRVESSYAKLEKGVIHGDLNEQNILVREDTTSKECGIHGIIDFGDLQESYYVFELSISLAYLMLQCSVGGNIDPIEGSALLLAGYSKHRKIPKLELDILRVCIAGRLCQSVVMGAYTYSQDPGNEYLLTTAKTGWDLLTKIWIDTTDEQLQSIWKM